MVLVNDRQHLFRVTGDGTYQVSHVQWEHRCGAQDVVD